MEAGNIGINIGVAAPTAPFPFSGARESFFGDLHGQGHDAVDVFYSEKGRGRTMAERIKPMISEALIAREENTCAP